MHIELATVHRAHASVHSSNQEALKGDDEYVKKVFAIGDTTDHAVQTKVLAGYGVKSHFSYNLSFS
jgi:hypothetical protein